MKVKEGFVGGQQNGKLLHYCFQLKLNSVQSTARQSFKSLIHGFW
jgi:hypothetical protein